MFSSSLFCGRVVGSVRTGVRTATKKAGGSSNNGRDSPGKRLGLKVAGGQFCKSGSILIRQR